MVQQRWKFPVILMLLKMPRTMKKRRMRTWKRISLMSQRIWYVNGVVWQVVRVSLPLPMK